MVLCDVINKLCTQVKVVVSSKDGLTMYEGKAMPVLIANSLLECSVLYYERYFNLVEIVLDI